MSNLIEYSDNYQDSSATLYQYKRDEPPEDDAIADLTADNSDSFKYKISLLGNPVVANNIARRSVQVVVPLKYLSNFFRSLEMPLINWKIKLNLTWKKECVLSTGGGDAVFIINDTKLHVPAVTLSKEDNKDFIEQQNKKFQRSIYWNEYKTKEINEDADANVFKYINLDPSFQGVNRLFVMAYNRANEEHGYLARMVYKFFDSKVASPYKKSTARPGSGFKKPSSSILADELHKPIIRTFDKRKVYSHFKDNIWGVDLADMQSLSRKNKGTKYLLCVIDLFSKYVFVIPLKDKK